MGRDIKVRYRVLCDRKLCKETACLLSRGEKGLLSVGCRD